MLKSEVIQDAKRRMQPFPCEGFLHGEGNERARVLFVGEAPGRTEIVTGKPFSGQSEKSFEAYLQLIGLSREDIYVTSTVRSRPYKTDSKSIIKPVQERGNRTPTKREIAAHAVLLDETIASIQPEIIVTLGRIALERLAGSQFKVSVQHGKPFCTKLRSYGSEGTYTRKNWSIVFPTYHPSAIFYRPAIKETILTDMKELKQLLTIL